MNASTATATALTQITQIIEQAQQSEQYDREKADNLHNLQFLAELGEYELVSVVVETADKIRHTFTYTQKTAELHLLNMLNMLDKHDAYLAKGLVWVSPSEWHELRYSEYPHEVLCWHRYRTPPKPIVM